MLISQVSFGHMIQGGGSMGSSKQKKLISLRLCSSDVCGIHNAHNTSSNWGRSYSFW